MTYNEAAQTLAEADKEKQIGEFVRIPIIAPEVDTDILAYLEA